MLRRVVSHQHLCEGEESSRIMLFRVSLLPAFDISFLVMHNPGNEFVGKRYEALLRKQLGGLLHSCFSANGRFPSLPP